MSIISALIFLLIIFSGSFFVTAYFDKKFEKTLPISCVSIVIVAFIFGFLGLLKYSVLFIGLVAIVLYILTIVKVISEKKIKTFFKNTITSGFILYAVFCLVFIIAIYGKLLDSWDEFSHWGDIVKAMCTIDDFGTNPISSSMYKTYPPGMSLFQYVLEKINLLVTGDRFVEWLTYFGYYSLAVAFIVPITDKISLNYPLHLLAISGAVMCIPFTFYNGVYYQLYIDPFLSFLICSGCLQLLYNENSRICKLNIFCTIVMLVLAKDAGLLFAVLIFVTFIVLDLKNNGGLHKNVIIDTVCSLLSIIVPKVLWTINCKQNNAKGMFEGKFDFVNLFEVIIGKDHSYRKEVLDNYISAIFNQGITLNNFNLKISYAILFIVLLVIMYIAYAYSKENKANKKAACITCVSSLIIFVIGTCVTYMYKFSEYEAVGLASFDRYISIVFMSAYLFAIIVLIIDVTEVKSRNIVCIAIILFMCVCAPVRIMLAWMYRSTVRASHNIRNEYTEIVNKTLEYADGDDEIWFIAQETTGFERLVYKFSIRPNLNDAWWSLGKPLYDGDDFTQEINANEWKEELINKFDYVSLYKLNDYFYENYSELFENIDDIGENRIYRVDINTGMLSLCE